MTPEEFYNFVNDYHKICIKILKEKETEYSAGQDRLIQFKTAANMKGEHPTESLIGMWTKHITSIFQLVAQYAHGTEVTDKMWDEKLIDSINYHYLLRALIEDLNQAK